MTKQAVLEELVTESGPIRKRIIGNEDKVFEAESSLPTTDR
jgi:hypothetical protein